VQTTIRKAALKDLDILLAFEQGIVQSERPFDPTLKDGEPHYYDLAALMTSPDAYVVVAEIENRIIGSGYTKIRKAEPWLKHEIYAYMGFMYVDPAFRGKGLIKKILDELYVWIRERKIKEVRLEVYADNAPAIQAYTKAGFKANMVEMRMELDV